MVPTYHSKTVNDKTVHKLENLLLRGVLVTIYKVFIRDHLDCGSIFYDQAYVFSPKTEINFAYVCLVIAGAI